MSKLSDDVSKKLKDTKESIQFLTDHIVEIDADKEAYDSGIEKIDRDLVSQLNAVNQTIGDVVTAYDARITVGCRTDMFWRVKSQNSSSIPATTTLVATKISLNGYDILLRLQLVSERFSLLLIPLVVSQRCQLPARMLVFRPTFYMD